MITSEISGNALPEIFRFWHGYAEGFRYAQTELTGGPDRDRPAGLKDNA